MRRLLPSPVLSVALFVLWLLLAQALDAGTLLLGALLALALPVATARLRPTPVRLRRPGVALRLAGRVVLEMLRSNAEVAWALLTRRSGEMQSGFVSIPLTLRDPNALAVLAAIVTFTPGTAWSQLSADGRVLVLHVLAIQDEDALRALFTGRYEPALREVFE